ncbi:MAG: ABC transporter ATP-binding protein, partial [Candidatus Hydrothermarchaeaceae archaeon]
LRRLRGKVISMIFQDPAESLNPVLTIGEQITETMRLHLKMPAHEAEERASLLLGQVGLSEIKLKSYPHELSGGMNQRVMIAMALSCNPKILIADEPTSALDVMTQFSFLKLLMSLRNKKEMSMIFITHDMGVVSEIADRIVVMYAGKVMEKGGVFQIFDNPRHPYTIGLLGCLPNITGNRKRTLTPIRGAIPSLIDPPPGCVFHPRCSFAKDICNKAAPDEATVEEGHFSACHFWDDSSVITAMEEVKSDR